MGLAFPERMTLDAGTSPLRLPSSPSFDSRLQVLNDGDGVVPRKTSPDSVLSGSSASGRTIVDADLLAEADAARA